MFYTIKLGYLRSWVPSVLSLSSNIEDFVLFTLYPKISLNVFISCDKAGMVWFSLDMNKITSSQYNEIWCSIGPTLIPQNWGCERTAIARGLIANVNRRGERGHPCLQPLLVPQPNLSRILKR